MDELLQVRDLKKYYTRGGSVLRAVDGISFQIPRGSTLGLVGESGCGKSTTGRLVLRLAGEKTGGQVLFHGQDIYKLPPRQLRRLRPKMQMVFQDPFSSLSPRMPVGELIGEAVQEHGMLPKKQIASHVDHIMESCGLQPRQKSRYPHEFSGGQRQRISIARALALNPEFVVCDEPVSALDVSVQAQIVNLLQDLQQQYWLTYLFISHDLSVVEHICDRVAVMYLGKLMELGGREEIFAEPMHPYTQALFSAILLPDPDRKRQRTVLRGALPSPTDPPSGCLFHTRCPYAMEICRVEEPAFVPRGEGRLCACHLYPIKEE